MIATTLLITKDSQLAKSVDEALTSMADCRLKVVRQLKQVPHLLKSPELALILYHETSETQQAEIPQLLEKLATSGRPVAVVTISDEYDPSRALELLRRGVADHLTHPVNLVRLAFLVQVLSLRVSQSASATESEAQPETVEAIGPANSFLFDSDEMRTIIDQVRAVAPLETTILLTGETGTGKNRLAHLIHELSRRSKEPFLTINCGALTPTLVESEMFGHVKGAFTGADNDRTGKFAAAGRGTLLLDEIDSLPWPTQSKLLRAVDERVFEPVGSNDSLPLQARLIVATNRCLEEEVAEGRFRSDLYFRVNVVAFELPPLRNRPSLIEPLANQLADEIATRNGCQTVSISDEVLAAMRAYDWPGNIRELRNVIERAISLNPNQPLEVSDLPEGIRRCAPEFPEASKKSPSSGWFQSKVDAEVNALNQALAKSGNNRARAAEELGISRVTLYKKLHKYGLI